MKKQARSLLSMVFVTLLIASLTVPAAASSGSGYYNSYYYTWSVTRTATTGIANITTPHQPASVGAHVVNYLRCNECGEVATVDSGHDSAGIMIETAGYASATATASNVFIKNSRSHTSTITDTNGSFRFQSQPKNDWLIFHKNIND